VNYFQEHEGKFENQLVRIHLNLWRDSWQNLFECIHAPGTKIETKGNFWAALQELKSQFDRAAKPK